MKGFCSRLQRSGWRRSEWEDGPSSCVSPGAGLPLDLAFNSFQSCSEWKKKVPTLLGENQGPGLCSPPLPPWQPAFYLSPP